MIYTPAYADYGCIHISQHIPKDKAEKLEYFAKISSLDDIEQKIQPLPLFIICGQEKPALSAIFAAFAPYFLFK
jgi:ribosomal protein L30E